MGRMTSWIIHHPSLQIFHFFEFFEKDEEEESGVKLGGCDGDVGVTLIH